MTQERTRGNSSLPASGHIVGSPWSVLPPRTIVVLAVMVLATLGFGIWTLLQAFEAQVDRVQTYGLPSASTGETPFVEAWSVRLTPPLVHEIALASGSAGEFFALNGNEILRIDANGAGIAKFPAPPRTSRIVADPSAVMPHLLAVSANTKWKGAIDHVVTTDYFLQALDGAGREVWKKRFDPKEVSAPEPLPLILGDTPAIVFSAGRRIMRFDVRGEELWNVPLWHHPGTLAPDGEGGLLAARAPRREIIRISADGRLLGRWGDGDGPSRFRMMSTRGGTYGLSVRQVFGRGPGVRHALTFYGGQGEIIREVELPPNATPLSYSPLVTVDVDGSGDRNWAIALGDGTILLFAPTGIELARQSTGLRLRTLQSLPQPRGPDLLITATHRGLTAWRPIARRLRGGR